MLINPKMLKTSTLPAFAYERKPAPVDEKQYTRAAPHVDKLLAPVIANEISGVLVRAEQFLGRGQSLNIRILGKPMVLHRLNAGNGVVLQTQNDFVHSVRNGLVLRRNAYGGHAMAFNNRNITSNTDPAFSAAHRQLTSLRYAMKLMPSAIYA